MEKAFWLEIRDHGYAPPEGMDIGELTQELLTHLGSPDAELRDEIAYETFANWLDQGRYTPDQLRAYILGLELNLQEGLGEPESDSLFLRAFSILWLAEIADKDNARRFLDGDEVRNILAKGLAYLEGEMDPRGYVTGKGWGHALAHTADLLHVLASSPHLHADDLIRMLNGLASKLAGTDYWIYVHGEDDRLARAACAILQRDLLDRSTLEAWLQLLTQPGDKGWKEAWMDEGRAAAFFNVRNFLRSLTIQVQNSASIPHKKIVEELLGETNAKLTPLLGPY